MATDESKNIYQARCDGITDYSGSVVPLQWQIPKITTATVDSF